MGLSSSAAQLQANAASLPKKPAADHRCHPILRDDLPVAIDGHHRGVAGGSILIAIWSAPGPETAVTAQDMNIDVANLEEERCRRQVSLESGWNIPRS